MMLWLQEQLGLMFKCGHWEASVHRLIMTNLCNFGLDEETLCQLLWAALGLYTSSFVHWLIDTILEQCSGQF